MKCYEEIVRRIIKFLLTYFLLLNYMTPQAQQSPGTSESFTADHYQKKITYTIIDAPNKTYCYDIYADGKLLIHQPSIPGMPGKQGFARKKDAEKVAALVVKKISIGEMPPTITSKDMDSLNVKF